MKWVAGGVGKILIKLEGTEESAYTRIFFVCCMALVHIPIHLSKMI